QTLRVFVLIGACAIFVFAVIAMWLVVRYTRELRTAQRAVEQLNTGLELRVADRTEALTRANDEIQRFAYIVSHDLRAPLVNIMGFTSELETGLETLQRFVALEGAPADGERAKAQTIANDDIPEAVRFIRASTTKMDGLINAIL